MSALTRAAYTRAIDKVRRNPGDPHISDTLAKQGVEFPQVYVIESDGRLSPEVWSFIRPREGKGYDVMAELCGPRFNGGPPRAQRRSVTIDRIVSANDPVVAALFALHRRQP